MTAIFRARSPVWILMILTSVGMAPLRAQVASTAPVSAEAEAVTAPADPPAHESLLRPFTMALGDIRRLPSRDNLNWLTAGLVAAAATHAADDPLSRGQSPSARDVFGPGSVLGATPIQLGAAFTTYVVGRAASSPRTMTLGSDLIRAQVLAEVVTIGVKQTVRRRRPEGPGFSFSSGHTAVTVASATVIARHFGWKAGLPAYAVAGYVAASRIQSKQHYLSDVVFGAAVGAVGGRTVTVGHGVRVEPMLVPGGAGAAFSWSRER